MLRYLENEDICDKELVQCGIKRIEKGVKSNS